MSYTSMVTANQRKSRKHLAAKTPIETGDRYENSTDRLSIPDFIRRLYLLFTIGVGTHGRIARAVGCLQLWVRRSTAVNIIAVAAEHVCALFSRGYDEPIHVPPCAARRDAGGVGRT